MQQGSVLFHLLYKIVPITGSNERDQFYARHLIVAGMVVACQQLQQVTWLSDEERILRSKAEG